MKHYDYIFFDLDGTLTDSGPGIFNAVRYALRYYGYAEPSNEELWRFVGPPLHESFQRFYGFDEPTSLEAVEVFREYYNVTGIFENSVYPGIPELLQALCAAGKTLMVATSKPQTAAERVLEHFGLRQYFRYVTGATADSSLVKKADIIAHVLNTAGVTGSDVLMVGDREHDVLGAKENGMACLGVLWGYGSREELEQAGASDIAENAEEARQIILT